MIVFFFNNIFLILILFKLKIFFKALKFLKPSYQVFITLLFAVVQILLVGIWFVIDAPKATVIYPDHKTGFLICRDVEDFHVLLALVYPFLLIAACTVLATFNRKIPTGFNETQHIGKYLSN